MADQVAFRRGTAAQMAAFTGVEGEITPDMTNKRLVLHDGLTVGGHPQATEAFVRGVLGIIPVVGRLTLTTATPVMQTSVAAATRVFFTSGQCPIYDGSDFSASRFSELSQDTTDATKSPEACGANKNYDLFIWNDGGTVRLSRGPDWSAGASAGSGTTRGSGAGSTELAFVGGIALNKNDITNGPPAMRGTYVGTVRTNGSSTVDFVFGSIGAGGVAGVFNVWNAYNRKNVSTFVGDNTDTWSQADSSGVYRSENNSDNNRVSFVRGLDEDSVIARYSALCTVGSGARAYNGIGVDSTSAIAGSMGFFQVAGLATQGIADYNGSPGLGAHYVQAIEAANLGAVTWLGDAGASGLVQTGLSVSLWL